MESLSPKLFRGHLSGADIVSAWDFSKDCPKPTVGRRAILLFTKQRQVYLVTTDLKRPVGMYIWWPLSAIRRQVENAESAFGNYASMWGFTDKELCDLILRNKPKHSLN